MSRTLLVITSLALILSGCQSTLSEPIITQTDKPPELPDTWTPEPAAPTSTTKFKEPNPTITPTPTPTDSPPTTPPPTSEPKPTRTRVPQPTPIPLVPGEEISITRIEMVTPQRGWAVGYQKDDYLWILFTEDGGNSWVDRTPPPAFYSLSDATREETIVGFWDDKSAWVLFPRPMVNQGPESSRIWVTTDSGLTWSSSDPLPYPDDVLYNSQGEFFFLNPQQGWLRTHHGITHMHDISYLFQTSDGGQTWLLVNRPGNSMIEVLVNSDMAFANPRDGWMLKDSLGGFIPLIESTRDGGLIWERIDLPPPNGDWLNPDSRCIGYDPVFFDGGRGTFLLNCLPYNIDTHNLEPEKMVSYLYSSLDWGATWQTQELPGSIDQLIFLNEQWGYALGREHFRTRDGGTSWEKIKSVSWSGDFSFISPQEAWAVARDEEDIALVHTADGGMTYQLIKPELVTGE